jgi:hypothetical protein
MSAMPSADTRDLSLRVKTCPASLSEDSGNPCLVPPGYKGRASHDSAELSKPTMCRHSRAFLMELRLDAVMLQDSH